MTYAEALELLEALKVELREAASLKGLKKAEDESRQRAARGEKTSVSLDELKERLASR